MLRWLFKVLLVLILVAALGVFASAAPAYAQEGGVSGQGAPPGGQTIVWAAFQGAPTIQNNEVAFWTWNQNVNGQNVLHIRTSSNGTAHRFTGTVKTGADSNFYNLALVNGEANDRAARIAYNEITFALVTSDGGDGVRVEWSGRWLSLDLYIDGYRRPYRVHYGAAGTRANALPLNVIAGKMGLLTLPLSVLDGETAFEKNIADGYFIYRTSDNRYHLRVTTTKQGDIVDYKGMILADGGTFGPINAYKNDARDYVQLAGDDALNFRFVTNGYVDGLDWTLNGGGGLIFTLRMNGQVAAPRISLGSNPFGQVKALTFRLVP